MVSISPFFQMVKNLKMYHVMKIPLIVLLSVLGLVSTASGATLWQSTSYFLRDTRNVSDVYWETVSLSGGDPPNVVLSRLVDRNGDAITSTCKRSDFIPSVNIGFDGPWTLDLGYANTPNNIASLTSVSFEVYTANITGLQLTYGRNIQPSLLVYDNLGGLVGSLWASNADENHRMCYDGGTSRNVATNFITFDLNGHEGFDPNNGFTFSLVMSDGVNQFPTQGYHIGVKSVSVSGDLIPEPSTGLLGICGMAALAFRRRKRGLPH